MATKLQPQNIEAEKAVIGSILIDKDAIVKVVEILQPEYFYDEKHRIIYEAIINLFEKRDPIDIVTIPAYLKKENNLKKAGGVGYITDLIDATPTSSNIAAHAELVKETAVRRKLIQISAEISDLGFKEDQKIEDILDLTEQKIFNVSQQNLKGDFVTIRKTLEEGFDLLDELYRNKGQLRGVPTGFPTVDAKLNGFRPANLIIIAARPSVGKSSFALNIAQYAAVHHKTPIAIFSLEMSRDELGNRMVASQADIDGFKITTGRMDDDELQAFGEASGILADSPIYIDDTPSISVMEVRAKARRLHMEKGLKMVIVDYLQLMRGRNIDNRVQEVSEISWGLKALAKELNIPVVAAAQLSRAVEARGTKVPQLSDLRESGSIEQDADVVMFLYRMDEENRNEVMLNIAKHRAGPTGTIPLFFRGERTRFYEMTKEQQADFERR